MGQLTDLIHSLATIIVRYHDYQGRNACVSKDSANPRKDSRDYVTTLLAQDDYNQELQTLISECTQDYAEQRRELLDFIREEINTLKKISARKTPFADKELEEYISKIAQLLIDFKGLLNTYKTKTCLMQEIHLDGRLRTSKRIPGAVRNAYKFCDSGTIINEEIFNYFNLKYNDHDDTLRKFAEEICHSHQKVLLLARLNANSEDLDTLKRTHKQAIEAQILANELLEKKINKLETLLKTAEEETKTYQDTLKQQKTIIDAQASIIEQQTTKLSEHESITREFKQKVNMLEALLKTNEEENKTQLATINQQKATIAEQNMTIDYLTSDQATQSQANQSYTTASAAKLGGVHPGLNPLFFFPNLQQHKITSPDAQQLPSIPTFGITQNSTE